MAQNVLVIDDDPDIREIVRVNLEGAGYRVRLAADGQEGLDAIQAERPDAIVLDVLMPTLDGWEVLDRLVRDPETAGMPIVMLTCKGDDQDILRGLDHGAVDYLTKPFYPENLVASVKILLDVFDSRTREQRRQQLIARRRRIIDSAATAP